MRSMYGKASKTGEAGNDEEVEERRRAATLLAEALEHTDVGDEDFAYERTDIAADFLTQFREQEERTFHAAESGASGKSASEWPAASRGKAAAAAARRSLR